MTPRLRRVICSGLVASVLSLIAMQPASAAHKTAHGTPTGPAPKLFAADFPTLKDSEWGFDIGGFGGISKGKAIAFNPVIFVHGNAYDAEFWNIDPEDVAAGSAATTVNVRRFFRAAGYTDQEIWGLSYNGVGCKNTATCGSANDVNVPDLFAFIQAVRAYTGAAHIDIVGHSLGVTIVRKTVKAHPELLDVVEDVVLIAGANHGTSSCKGVETTWYGCDEVFPGSPWLNDLNTWNPKGEGDETPGPPRYMTIYDGSGVVDTFYVGADADSPALSGAQNIKMVGTAHLPLARGRAALDTYLPFLQGHNIVSRTDGGPIEDPSTRTNVAGKRGKRLADSGSFEAIGGPLFLLLALIMWTIARPSRKQMHSRIG